MTRQARIPSSRQALAAVGPFLESFPEVMELDHLRRMNMRLAVGEIVTNAILHGNKESAELPVDISVCATSDEITIIVRDYGEGFLPESVPDPRLPELREQPGGRGIFLTTKLADSVAFERATPGMQVTIIFLR
jgi:anti-sigma regulatory factor (Ser/Thr protein kinase)